MFDHITRNWINSHGEDFQLFRGADSPRKVRAFHAATAEVHAAQLICQSDESIELGDRLTGDHGKEFVVTNVQPFVDKQRLRFLVVSVANTRHGASSTTQVIQIFNGPVAGVSAGNNNTQSVAQRLMADKPSDQPPLS